MPVCLRLLYECLSRSFSTVHTFALLLSYLLLLFDPPMSSSPLSAVIFPRLSHILRARGTGAGHSSALRAPRRRRRPFIDLMRSHLLSMPQTSHYGPRGAPHNQRPDAQRLDRRPASPSSGKELYRTAVAPICLDANTEEGAAKLPRSPCHLTNTNAYYQINKNSILINKSMT